MEVFNPPCQGDLTNIALHHHVEGLGMHAQLLSVPRLVAGGKSWSSGKGKPI